MDNQEENKINNDFESEFNQSIDSTINNVTVASSSDGIAAAIDHDHEIFYAAESLTRLSFVIDDNHHVVNESIGDDEIFDEKELVKAIEIVENLVEQQQQQEENTIQDEFGVLSLDWRTQDKHIFILSEAGKPIYTL
jgi:hypothetical protein